MSPATMFSTEPEPSEGAVALQSDMPVSRITTFGHGGEGRAPGSHADILPTSGTVAKSAGSWRSTARDLFALTKPRITVTVLATTAAGIGVAGRDTKVGLGLWLTTLLGTALVVGSANALNMYLERDVDGLMERTKDRPLPAGRLSAGVALWFGLTLASLALPLLWLGVGTAAGILGAVALVSYVLMYTPAKRWTPHALWIGAVPGAIPPLLGAAAVSQRIDTCGLALFAILFAWQVPHVLAISVSRASEYARAGLQCAALRWDEGLLRSFMIASSLVLALTTVGPYALALAGPIYLVVALTLGAGFVALSTRGVRKPRTLFAYSVVYLVLVFAALLVPFAPPAKAASTSMSLLDAAGHLSGGR